MLRCLSSDIQNCCLFNIFQQWVTAIIILRLTWHITNKDESLLPGTGTGTDLFQYMLLFFYGSNGHTSFTSSSVWMPPLFGLHLSVVLNLVLKALGSLIPFSGESQRRSKCLGNSFSVLKALRAWKVVWLCSHWMSPGCKRISICNFTQSASR